MLNSESAISQDKKQAALDLHYYITYRQADMEAQNTHPHLSYAEKQLIILQEYVSMKPEELLSFVSERSKQSTATKSLSSVVVPRDKDSKTTSNPDFVQSSANVTTADVLSSEVQPQDDAMDISASDVSVKLVNNDNETINDLPKSGDWLRVVNKKARLSNNCVAQVYRIHGKSVFVNVYRIDPDAGTIDIRKTTLSQVRRLLLQ